MTLSNNENSHLSKTGRTGDFADVHIGIIGTGTIAGMLVHCFDRAVPDTRVLVAGRNDLAVSELVTTASK